MDTTSAFGPDSELLRTFLAVATHGNTTKAARAISKTQSAVSIHIKKLERELGVELFDRLPRGMRLTHAGRSLVPRAERAIVEIDAIGDLFNDPLTGSIRLGIPDDYSTVVLQHALLAFSQRHSGVEVRVTSGCSGAYPDMIEQRQLDLAIYSSPPTDPTDAFFEEPMRWAAHRDLDLDTTAPIPLAVFDRSCWWRNVPTDTLERAGHDWYVAFASESHDGIRAAIRSRIAVGILSDSVLPDDVTALHQLPDLPSSRLVLLSSRTAPDPVTDAMAAALKGAFHMITPSPRAHGR